MWRLILTVSILAPLARLSYEHQEVEMLGKMVLREFPVEEKFGTLVHGDHMLFKFNVKGGEDVIRVVIKSINANESSPILVVVRKTTDVLSWSVPALVKKVSRTLCPAEHFEDNTEISVELTTSSKTPVGYMFSAKRIPHQEFHLTLENNSLSMEASSTEPQYIRYTIPENVENILVEVDSDDDVCMIVAIQDVDCPVYDLPTNVFFRSIHQSVRRKAAISIQRSKRKTSDFYVVFVVMGDDRECAMRNVAKKNHYHDENLIKNFTVTMREDFTDSEFHLAITVTGGIIAAMYVVAIIISFLVRGMDGRERTENEERIHAECTVEVSDHGEGGVPIEGVGMVVAIDVHDHDIDSSGLKQRNTVTKIDDPVEISKFIASPEEHDRKVCLTVRDLARKSWVIRDKRYSTYYWQVLIIALIYIPPVVQLVVAWEYASSFTGDQDLCYYNFLCTRRFLAFSAFNNIFSNIGYIMLGFLYIILVYNRSSLQKRQMCRNPLIDQQYGVPKHYGLFYALGTCLLIEGIMSGCYHVCPNNNNFQFDTAFMYIMGALGILKVYQIRHPDISASSYIAFAVLAMVILISVVGVGYSHTIAFWGTFSFCYLALLVTLSVELYYKGEYHLGSTCVSRFFRRRRACANWCMPSHPDRIIFLTVGNFLNLFFIVMGLLYQPSEFGTFMLGIFIANLLLYTMYYLLMKVRYKEKLRIRTILYIIMSGICWGPALYFFFSVKYDTGLSPAASRGKNEPCILFNYYDVHDIWHFLSALGLFFSFLVLLNIDDDLNYVPSDKIPVF